MNSLQALILLLNACLTLVNKSLIFTIDPELPSYDKPMIYNLLNNLILAIIHNNLIISMHKIDLAFGQVEVLA